MTDCKIVTVGDIQIAKNLPFTLVAGPCVIEGEDSTLQLASRIHDIAQRVNVPLIFKASFDKANRTSVDGFRGPGMDTSKLGFRHFILQRFFICTLISHSPHGAWSMQL